MSNSFAIPFIIVFIIAIVIIAVGVTGAVILIRSGKRGRLVNDHPICCACGFDLYNLPSDRVKCPECGGDLTKPKAILPGYRQPYLGRLWAGCGMLAIIVVSIAVNGIDLVDRPELQHFKPSWWLQLEADHGAIRTQQMAWRTLKRRAADNGLSDDRAASLTDSALDLQQDLTRTWIDTAGAFVEAARQNGQVTDAQWSRYAKQAPQITLVVRDKVGRAAKYLPAELRIAKARSADNSMLVQRTEEGLATGDCIRVLPEWQRSRGSSGFTMSSTASGSHMQHIQLDPKDLATTQPGKRTVTIEVPIRFTEGWEDDAAEVYAEMRTFQADWELVDADQPDITLLPDDSPELHAQVESAISIDSIEFKPSESGDDRIEVNVIASGLPVPVAYRVSLRAGERTWDGFNFRYVPTSGRSHFGSDFQLKGFDAERVDVIFEPSPAAALETTNMTQLWGGRVVIEDVIVQRGAPATQP